MAKHLHILERIQASQPSRVDRGAGVIYGVKVLGIKSSNGRRYTPECLRGAVGLYEGAAVYIDHREDDDTQRSSKDRLGKLINVRFSPRGIFGDLLLLKTHPLSESIFEAAEDPRKHDFWGLSHDAEGEREIIGGEDCIVHITEVHSVDLVATPATTQGLFESKQRKPRKTSYRGRSGMKLKEWFSKAKLLPIARRRIRKLFEAGGMDEDMPIYEMDVDGMGASPDAEADEPVTAAPTSPDPASMDPTDALKQGLGAAFGAVIHDNTLDSKAKLARAKQLINAWEELLDSGEEVTESDHEEPDGDESGADASAGDGDGDEDDTEEGDLFEGEDGSDGSSKRLKGKDSDTEDITEECDEDEKDMKEAKKLKARNDLLERELAVRDLLEAEEVPGTPALKKALLALPDKTSRLELIREHKVGRLSRRPRSTVGGGPGGKDQAVNNVDDFVAAITRN